MEKLSPNHVKLLRNRYTVFTMSGNEALRSVKKKMQESYSSAASKRHDRTGFQQDAIGLIYNRKV